MTEPTTSTPAPFQAPSEEEIPCVRELRERVEKAERSVPATFDSVTHNEPSVTMAVWLARRLLSELDARAEALQSQTARAERAEAAAQDAVKSMRLLSTCDSLPADRLCHYAARFADEVGAAMQPGATT